MFDPEESTHLAGPGSIGVELLDHLLHIARGRGARHRRRDRG
jgi:hypothetical protein